METFIQFHQKLAKCYNRINYKQYFFLSEDEQSEYCSRERESLAEYLNSDAMKFENIIKERISLLKNAEERVTSSQYTVPKEGDLDRYINL